MVRTVIVLVAVVLVVGLGAVQLASSAAYGDLAVRGSLPSELHAADPALLRPLLGGAAARAAAAIHDGDLTGAERLVAALPDDARTADLRGQIAQARGERDAAIAPVRACRRFRPSAGAHRRDRRDADRTVRWPTSAGSSQRCATTRARAR